MRDSIRLGKPKPLPNVLWNVGIEKTYFAKQQGKLPKKAKGQTGVLSGLVISAVPAE
jgi:hypothetical protein